MQNNEEFKDYIITKIYIESYNNQIIVSIGKNNINIPSNLITINNNLNNNLNTSKLNNEKYNIIEREFNYNYDTFQYLNINENKKVYFETKENIEENNNSKIKNKLLFDLYKKIGLIKINNIFYLN